MAKPQDGTPKVEFEEIDVQIPFHKLPETPFEGTLKRLEDRGEKDSVVIGLTNESFSPLSSSLFKVPSNG